MGEWWNRPWVQRHATMAPFGIFATTMLLTYSLEQWRWRGGASWDRAADTVDLGAVLYAMLAVLVEKGGNLMFWAWEKHKERTAKRRAMLSAELLAAMQAEARDEEKHAVESVAQRVAQAQGIALHEGTQQ